jgi:hypothetical protein
MTLPETPVTIPVTKIHVEKLLDRETTWEVRIDDPMLFLLRMVAADIPLGMWFRFRIRSGWKRPIKFGLELAREILLR